MKVVVLGKSSRPSDVEKLLPDHHQILLYQSSTELDGEQIEEIVILGALRESSDFTWFLDHLAFRVNDPNRILWLA